MLCSPFYYPEDHTNKSKAPFALLTCCPSLDRRNYICRLHLGSLISTFIPTSSVLPTKTSEGTGSASKNHQAQGNRWDVSHPSMAFGSPKPCWVLQSFLTALG